MPERDRRRLQLYGGGGGGGEGRAVGKRTLTGDLPSRTLSHAKFGPLVSVAPTEWGTDCNPEKDWIPPDVRDGSLEYERPWAGFLQGGIDNGDLLPEFHQNLFSAGYDGEYENGVETKTRFDFGHFEISEQGFSADIAKGELDVGRSDADRDDDFKIGGEMGVGVGLGLPVMPITTDDDHDGVPEHGLGFDVGIGPFHTGLTFKSEQIPKFMPDKADVLGKPEGKDARPTKRHGASKALNKARQKKAKQKKGAAALALEKMRKKKASGKK